MLLKFTLPTKAFSVNRYFYATKRIKTKDALAWEATTLQLLGTVPELQQLKEAYKVGGAFKVEFRFTSPQHIFYNRAGLISSKAFDLSNVEKPLLDLIFGRTLGIDDKYVVELLSSKQAGTCFSIDVIIELLEF